MTIEEMTTFVNIYNPLRNRVQVKIILDHYYCGYRGPGEFQITHANMTLDCRTNSPETAKPEFGSSGIYKITIYITRAVFFLKEDQIKSILIHEMGHLNHLIGFSSGGTGRFATHIERLADLYSIQNHHDMTQFLSDSMKEYSGRDRLMISKRIEFSRKMKEIYHSRKTKKNKDSTYPIQN